MLIQKITVDIKPFTTMMLKLLFQAVVEEKSAAVKRALAFACAITLKYASPPQAQKLIEDTSALHLGERNAQISGAVLLKAYLNLAPDVLSGYHAIVVPLTFVLRFVNDMIEYYFSYMQFDIYIL